ncbi:MAG: oligosaccharide flippase family protein [Thiotrichaceae bacterium]
MKKHSFISNVATLASGTVIAQLLPLLASPVLTRLYSPEQFGLFAIFMGFVTSLTQASTGHYEVAMVTPKHSYRAKQLFVVALYFSLGFAMITFLGVTFFHQKVLNLLNASELANWIYLVPLMVLTIGLAQLANYYANRSKHYSFMAQAALLQGITIVSISILLGILEIGFSGLVIAYACGSFVSFIFLWWRHKTELTSINFGISKYTLKVAHHYKDYPLFSGSMSIFDGLSLALPTFFLAAGYPEAIVGYYALVMRILYSPLTFLSTSVGQVNLKKVVDLVHAKRSVLPYLHKVTLALIAISAIPTLLLLFFGPQIFTFIFGKDWLAAGEYAQILAPALVVRFTASTLSSTLGATQHPRLSGLWKVVAFVGTFSVLWIFSGNVSAQQMLKYLVITDIILYLFYYTLIYSSASRASKLTT